jgi:hypothetical protein
MDQVTQQNAALVEESAAAAESLRQQAEQLVHAVAVFKLGQGELVAAPPVAVLGPSGAERRGPNRATNVRRPTFGKKPASVAKGESTAPVVVQASKPSSKATGTVDWESF